MAQRKRTARSVVLGKTHTILQLAGDLLLVFKPFRVGDFVVFNDEAADANHAGRRSYECVQIVGPASGGQACGEMGMGRMTEPADILADVQFFFQPKRLAGRRVVVTAGPTDSTTPATSCPRVMGSGRTGDLPAR